MKTKINLQWNILPAICASILFYSCGSGADRIYKADKSAEIKLLPPPSGKIYHSAFPNIGAPEDKVSREKITAFEALAGKKIAWTYFSNNWFDGKIKFPQKNVKIIYDHGSIPFIRLMPRADYSSKCPDPVFTMQKIIDGIYDEELIQWANDAKDSGIPLLAEFGTECNGSWFPWNAKYNGADSKTGYGDPELYDGMERFRDAYRHIINIAKAQGALNITWFYHADATSDPKTDWNNITGYYPGDEYIDWIGLSVYGPQEPTEKWRSFSEIMQSCWDEVAKISETGKPIALLEWGVIDYPGLGSKAEWFRNAFKSVTKDGEFYPYIKAVSYWNESFGRTNLRIDSSPEALEAYRSGIQDSAFIDAVYSIYIK